MKTPIKGTNPVGFLSPRAQTLGIAPCHCHTATHSPEQVDCPRSLAEERRHLWWIHLHQRNPTDRRHRRQAWTKLPHHRCPPSSQGEQNRFTTLPRCRRCKSHRKLRLEAPYTANSGEPPSRAGRAAVESTAPWPELPLAICSPISAPD
jgi:hypothetical protein